MQSKVGLSPACTLCWVDNMACDAATCKQKCLLAKLTRQPPVDKNGNLLMPCGRCRQLLFEHSADDMVLETASGIKTIAEVLPDAFGPKDLDR